MAETAYTNKKINGFRTRCNVIASMNIKNAASRNEAIDNYCNAWFNSPKKQYLNTALQMIASSKKQFWPDWALPDMLDETAVNSLSDDKKAMMLIDKAKSKWVQYQKNQSKQDFESVKRYIKSLEKYDYKCPETFRFCWMNNGAYVTLKYAIQYEDLLIAKDIESSLALLDTMAMKVLLLHDHDCDSTLLEMCYELYKN